jgi:hypothetical protein
MITAGPTREPLDPVRYITNHSSGKMGFAIAAAAATRRERHAGERPGIAAYPPLCSALMYYRAGNGSGRPGQRSAAAHFYWLRRGGGLSPPPSPKIKIKTR